MRTDVHNWLDRFELDGVLRQHIAAVLLGLPHDIRSGLMEDARFQFCDYEPADGAFYVPMSAPSVGQLGASRCVVLKRTLRGRPVAFVRYVIAHELAHAHLRHAGRHPGEDPEHAADALAAEWGFPRP
jgi:Zn-dependent protease with chaperone function